MIKSLRVAGPIFILLAAFLWSLDGVLRRSLYILPPIIIVFYEHLIGSLLILPLLFTEFFKQDKKLTPKQFLALLWVSLVSGVLGTLFYTTALAKINYIQFSVVVLLQQLQPIFAIAAAALILKEPIGKNYLRWAILALLSAYFVSFPDLKVNLQTGSGTTLAALLAIGAAFFWGSSTAISRYGLLELSHLTMTGLRFLITTFMSLGLVFALGQNSQLASLTGQQLLTVLAIALSTGLVAMVIYYRGLKFTQARVSTILELFWPISAIFISFFYYKESLTLTQILGSAVLLFSIYKVSSLNRSSS